MSIADPQLNADERYYLLYTMMRGSEPATLTSLSFIYKHFDASILPALGLIRMQALFLGIRHSVVTQRTLEAITLIAKAYGDSFTSNLPWQLSNTIWVERHKSEFTTMLDNTIIQHKFSEWVVELQRMKRLSLSSILT